MGNNISILKSIAENGGNNIEHAENVIQFCNEALTDKHKAAAIDRFFINSPTSNPFESDMSYYDLLNFYQDVLNEED